MDEKNINPEFSKIYSNNKLKSFIAGILLIIAGSISILMWIGLASLDIPFIESIILPEFQNIPGEYTIVDISSDSIKELLIICGSIGFFLSIFTILGGIMSIKHQMWKISIVGGTLGIFSIGPLFVSSILSAIGVILVFISRNEFQ